MAASRALIAALLLAALAVAGGCAGKDAQRVAEDSRDRVDELERDARDLRDRAEKLRKKISDQVREQLEKLERGLPEAGPQTRPPRRGNASLEAFLTEILRSVDRYWTATFRQSGLEDPRVDYLWVAAGDRRSTRCRAEADEDAAFYCPTDDTIYVGQRFASDILEGIREDLPGSSTGARAVGDFGVSYIVAHEYAHNVQTELGYFEAGHRLSVKPFELQADCMAGAWGNSVYQEGKLEPGDVEEALGTAEAAGDFEYQDPQHHGTPDERRIAWLRGYRSGDPSACSTYVPV